MRALGQARCLLAVLRARLLLALFPLRLALRWSVRAATDRPKTSPSDPLEFLGWAASKVPKTTCLPRAIAAQRLLAKAGRTGTIIFGVRRLPGGRLDAHAWLEEQGVVVHGALPHLGEFARLSTEHLPKNFG